MTDKAIEAAARAIRENDSWRTWKGDEAFVQMARAAAPALRQWLWVNFGWDCYDWNDDDLRF